MSHIPEEAQAIVVVFVMEGCGACHEFLPTFRRVARQWNQTVPAYILQADDPNPEIQALADRLKVTATPTTAAVRRGVDGAVKLTGSHDETAVHRLFQQAHMVNQGRR